MGAEGEQKAQTPEKRVRNQPFNDDEDIITETL